MKVKFESDKAIVRFKNQNEKILFAQWIYDMKQVLEEDNYEVKIKDTDRKILKKRKVITKDSIKSDDNEKEQ